MGWLRQALSEAYVREYGAESYAEGATQRYAEGWVKGYAEAYAAAYAEICDEDCAEDWTEGYAEAAAEDLTHFVQSHFGSLPPSARQRVIAVGLESIETWVTVLSTSQTSNPSSARS